MRTFVNLARLLQIRPLSHLHERAGAAITHDACRLALLELQTAYHLAMYRSGFIS